MHGVILAVVLIIDTFFISGGQQFIPFLYRFS
jgi:hypothetical protein